MKKNKKNKKENCEKKDGLDVWMHLKYAALAIGVSTLIWFLTVIF